MSRPGRDDDLGAQPACHLTTTNHESGRLRIVEAPYALHGRRLYALAEAGPLAAWVRDLLRDPAVSVRVGEVALHGRALVLDPGPEVERARELLLAKYGPGDPGDASYWIRSGQPVRIDLESR